jgi:hypothetical protein
MVFQTKNMETQNTIKKHGGSGRNQGRKPKFLEETIGVTFN